MCAERTPIFDDDEVAVEKHRQVVARHHSTGEEVLRQLIARVADFVGIRKTRMRKDVEKQLSVRF
jgi:hypothetical protein